MSLSYHLIVPHLEHQFASPQHKLLELLTSDGATFEVDLFCQLWQSQTPAVQAQINSVSWNGLGSSELSTKRQSFLLRALASLGGVRLWLSADQDLACVTQVRVVYLKYFNANLSLTASGAFA